MSIRVLGAADIPALEAFVRPRLASSLFLLGNLRLSGIRDNDAPYSGTYVGRFRGGELTGLVAHYWNGNVMLQTPGPGDAEALTRAALAATGARGLRGLLGPNDHVVAARDGLGVPPGLLQLDQEDGLFQLKLDALRVPAALGAGALQGRLAEAADLDELTLWRIDYEVNLVHAADTPAMRADARTATERAIRERRLWVVERDGARVALSGFNATADDVVQIGGVYTPPALRGRGHARAVVAASLLAARAEGRRQAVLFTGEHNIAAQRAYLALGFERIGSYRLTLLREAWLPA